MKKPTKECAFCSHSGNLSLEHITSEWMNTLFPGENIHQREARGKRAQWTTHDEIDWKARVVCETCNTGWMSNIESKHAKPVLTPLITGHNVRTEITQEIARSIALWVFKTAIVLDHAHHRANPWFPDYVREQLRVEQKMPSTVKMWICGVRGGRRHINLRAAYGAMNLSPTYPVYSYIVTGGIGNFAFQFCSIKQKRNIELFPLPEFDDIAIPIWPGIYSGITWPFTSNLAGENDLTRFSDRWSSIAHIPPLVE